MTVADDPTLRAAWLRGETELRRANLSGADARYAGLVDWAMIEDRGREPDVPTDFENLDELVEAALRSYRLPRWEGQVHYVELWVEKQALAGVLAPIARQHHITLMVNKGYSSSSAMKEAADRIRSACKFGVLEAECNAAFGCDDNTDPEPDEDDVDHEAWEERDDKRRQLRDEWEERGKDAWNAEVKRWAERMFNECRKPIILYLGDHDPSGEDMVRDIADRLKEFRVTGLKVQKVALTMAQIRKHNPPPNPAKVTDSRAKAYIAKYGDKSWELDALPPRELNRLVEAAILEVLDVAKVNAIIAKEKKDKAALRKAVGKLNGKGAK